MRRVRLIEAREGKNLSQADLAEALQCSVDSVHRWEHGLNDPGLHARRQLQAFFGVEDLSAILEVTQDEESSPIGTILNLTPSHSRLRLLSMNLTSRLLSIAHTDYPIPDTMQVAVQTVIQETDTMNMGNPNYEITRREALYTLASLPAITLGQKTTLKTAQCEELLRHSTAALEACWELYRGSDTQGAVHAFDCTSVYVPILETIARDSSRYRKEAFDLAAQYAIVRTMLGWCFLKRVESISHAQNALGLSKESGDILLQMVATCKLSYTYITAKNYTKALETMQEGEHILIEYQHKKRGPVLPSGMIGNFYSGYALAQVHNGVDPDMALGIATSSAPLDHRIAFSEFTLSEQAIEASWTYSTKGDIERAMIWLKKLIDPDTLASRICTQSEHEHCEALNILTQVLLQSAERDMEHIVYAWTRVMEWAQLHQKEVLYDGAMTNFAMMRALWPGEDAIRRLLPLTSHW